MSPLLRRLSVLGALLPLALEAGCRNDDRPAPGEKVETGVICLDCKAQTTLTLSHYLGQETWPKTCAACQKTSVYPYKPCTICEQPVPLKDPATGKFGYPKLCPSCNKRWED